MKFMPEIRFRIDTALDYAEKIDRLLKDPAVAPRSRPRQGSEAACADDPMAGSSLDKPEGLASTQAVARVKRLFNADKAGHAGTLDPLASGLLPIALGEATKTVSFAMDGRKTTVHRADGARSAPTDDREGAVTATSDSRPSHCRHRGDPDRFDGEIMQIPPAFSAIKVKGERAYDLARAGETVDLAPRPVVIERLELLACPTPIMPNSRPNAAKAPISGRLPATWAGLSAVLAMSRRSGAPRSGRLAKRT